MITLQLKELMKMQGIKKPMHELKKAGISRQIAYNYLSGKKRYILFKHINAMCLLLRCTPNDLMAWTPDSTAEDVPENPLQQIKKSQLPDLQKVLSTLSNAEIKKRLEGA